MKGYYELRARHFSIGEGHDFHFPAHFHKEVEMIYLLDGEMMVTEGDTVYPLHKGELLVIFPNRVHAYKTPKNAHHILVIFNTEWSGSYQKELISSIPVCPVLTPDMLGDFFKVALLEMLKEQRLQKPHSEEICRDLMTALLGQILRNTTLKEYRLSSLSTAAAIIGYCMKNYQNPIHLSDIAAAVGVNPYQISKIFNKQIGCGFCEYINTLRINEACAKLKKTNDSIMNIAMDCGFDNQRSFGRAFLKLKGVSPREYRNENQAREE